MYIIPGLFAILLIPTVILPICHGKSAQAKTKYQVNPDTEKAQLAGPKITGLILIQLLVLPLYAGFSYIADVVTDYIAFFTYVFTDNAMHGLATLALILFSAIVTSTIASTSVFFNKSKFFFERLTKTPLRRAITFISMSCNFGPVLIQLQLFLTNIEILQFLRAKMEVPFKLRHKQNQIMRLLVKLAVSELICESLGQGILQAFILSKQLGTEDICLPQRGFMTSNISETKVQWTNIENNTFRSFVTSGSTAQTRDCSCELRIAKGAEHCYSENYLKDDFDEPIVQGISCHIADCTTNKIKFQVIFPFVQVVCSIFQISFAMTHLGAVNNLHHIASLQVMLKKGFFYLITFFFFLFSLCVSLLFSTYFANIYNEGLFQLLAFLSVLRLILPESTPARKYLSPWLMRILTILLPLIAHLPFYYLLYNSEETSCLVQARNHITIHMRKERTFNRNIAAYLATAPGVEKTLESQLRNMELFPINLNDLTDDQKELYKLPSSTDDGIYNIRNRFNIFGHFFLWNGYVVVADISMTAIFLCYWIFVVRAYHRVPTMNKLVDKMMSFDIGPVGFKEAQEKAKVAIE